MNRGELVEEVGQQLGLGYDRDGYERDFLRDLANRAVVDILLKTHVYIQIGDVALTSGVAEYRMDTNVLAIDDGSGSTPAGIGHYTVVGLDEMIQRESVGIVSPTFRKVLAFEGDLLIVDPVPESDESLTFYYVPRPTAMSDDGNDPSSSAYGGIPVEHHDAVIEYMSWRASMYEGASSPLKPQEYRVSYLGMLKDIQTARRRMRGRRIVVPRIGYPDKRRVITKNSAYPGNC